VGYIFLLWVILIVGLKLTVQIKCLVRGFCLCVKCCCELKRVGGGNSKIQNNLVGRVNENFMKN
jgi:hypothetical protein